MYFVPLSLDGELGGMIKGVVQTVGRFSLQPLFLCMVEGVAGVMWSAWGVCHWVNSTYLCSGAAM